MSEFLAMGGYAEFVWPAYGISGLVLTWLVVASLRALKTEARLLADLEARRPHRGRREGKGDKTP